MHSFALDEYDLLLDDSSLGLWVLTSTRFSRMTQLSRNSDVKAFEIDSKRSYAAAAYDDLIVRRYNFTLMDVA